MNKIKFFSFIKNPLWIIIILLIVMNFLLWNISEKIGHDYIFKSNGVEVEKNIKATGLYKTIYNAKPEIPYYSDELERIIKRLDWVDDKLNDIEWNTR